MEQFGLENHFYKTLDTMNNSYNAIDMNAPYGQQLLTEMEKTNKDNWRNLPLDWPANYTPWKSPTNWYSKNIHEWYCVVCFEFEMDFWTCSGLCPDSSKPCYAQTCNKCVDEMINLDPNGDITYKCWQCKNLNITNPRFLGNPPQLDPPGIPRQGPGSGQPIRPPSLGSALNPMFLY